ncbi:hypothetical protein H1R20_g3425, partial [Candolleomyces eurysporus]
MAYQPQGSGEAAQQPLATAAAPTTQYIHQYYQAPYNATAATTPIVAPGALSYYAFQPSANGQKTSEIVPPPAEPSVTPEIAEKAIRKLVTVELKNAGFEKAEPMTVKQLEYEVQAFVQQLYERAHEYANLANRAGVIAPDLLQACEEFYMPASELQSAAKRAKKKKRKFRTADVALSFLPSESRSSSPELLSSDDEAVANTAAVPLTLRMLPPHFPSLPPKHTYMKTPVCVSILCDDLPFLIAAIR